MKPLNPAAPFVWPEPRALEKVGVYEHQPPFAELALGSDAVFGMLSALTERGVAVLKTWLDANQAFKANLIVTVYPTCTTRQEDLTKLLQVVETTSGRLAVHIRPLKHITDRATNALCFLKHSSDSVHLVTGSTEDLGLDPSNEGQVNFVFRAHPALVESFKRYFDWLWIHSREISAKGVTLIPDLFIPEGTEEGARLWRNYMLACVEARQSEDAPQPEANSSEEAPPPPLVAHVDPETGDVTIWSNEGQEVTPPTEELGLAKLDPLADQIAHLYEKGSLVSIDKLSRIPPLDAPVRPGIFGDEAEMNRGNVTRRVNTRVSAIDESTLKEINKRRMGVSTLLAKFSFALADKVRWMPATARELFESELKRVNDEGLKLVSDLLKGDVDAFLKGKRSEVSADINKLYADLGRSGQVSEAVIDEVVESIKIRLCKAQSASFMPKLSYSTISFGRTENALSSPWGQAYSLLSDIAVFPRKVLTDNFFLRGVRVPEDDLIEAMNVADDALCCDLRTRGIKTRCTSELELLYRIEEAAIESRDRCVLVSRLLVGDSVEAIVKTIRELETRASEVPNGKF